MWMASIRIRMASGLVDRAGCYCDRNAHTSRALLSLGGDAQHGLRKIPAEMIR